LMVLSGGKRTPYLPVKTEGGGGKEISPNQSREGRKRIADTCPLNRGGGLSPSEGKEGKERYRPIKRGGEVNRGRSPASKRGEIFT